MSYRISVQMDDELGRLVKQYAQDSNCSISEAIKINMARSLWEWRAKHEREAIEFYLEVEKAVKHREES